MKRKLTFVFFILLGIVPALACGSGGNAGEEEATRIPTSTLIPDDTPTRIIVRPTATSTVTRLPTDTPTLTLTATSTDTPTPSVPMAVVTESTAVRMNPHESQSIVFWLGPGDVVVIIGLTINAVWYQIQTGDGQTGWAQSRYVDRTNDVSLFGLPRVGYVPPATSAPRSTATNTRPAVVNTNTPRPASSPTQPLATFTSVPTLPPTLPPTAAPPTVPPAVCGCSGDLYNCSDFANHNAAQACFNYCVAQSVGDIHGLDADGDGIACESLP